VCFLIGKAREFDGKVGSSDPQATLMDDEDPEAAVLEDRPSDPVQKEMASLIHDLTVDQKLDLVVLMWIGRGDGGAADWQELRLSARQEFHRRAARYILGTPLLGDYLEGGLEAVGLSCSDYNETTV
jgi:hypothetical protein